MRHILLTFLPLAVTLSACGDGEDPGGEPESSELSEAGGASEAGPSAKQRPDSKGEGGALTKEPVPLPDAVAVEGYPTVAILGHGVRLELNPPFQAAVIGVPRAPRDLAAAGAEGDQPQAGEGKGRLIVSWWDVTEKNAGKSGIVGLHNTVIIPGEVASPEAELTPSTTGEGKRLRHRLSQGEGGTVVELPRGASTLGGALSVLPGPVDQTWTVQVGEAEPLAWPEGELLHSGDPGDGGPIYFDGRPQRPWGPWPAEPAPTPAPAGAEDGSPVPAKTEAASGSPSQTAAD